MYKPDKIVVIDLEATCWGDDEIPIGSSVDILEIGICNLVVATGEITDKQSIYVIPERSEITPFCTELTGITHDLISEKGIPFADACKIVREQYEPEQRLWAGYGAFDRRFNWKSNAATYRCLFRWGTVTSTSCLCFVQK